MQRNFRKYFPSVREMDRCIRFYYLLHDAAGSRQMYDNHPQGTIDVQFTLGGTTTFAHGNEAPTKLDGIFIVGQQQRHFRFGFDPHTTVVGIVFHAPAFAKLSGIPLEVFTNVAMDVTQLLPQRYRDLWGRLFDAKSDADRVELLDAFCRSELYLHNVELEPLDELLMHLRSVDELPSVAELANMANVGIRSLQRHTRQALGISPKSYLQVLRFNRTLSELNAIDFAQWQDPVFDAGYYDQAHFIKDFKRFTGHAPTAYLNEQHRLAAFFREGQS